MTESADKNVYDLQGRRMTEGNEPRPDVNMTVEKPAAEYRKALEKIRDGGVATKVRILISHDACPVCKAIEGAYEFEEVPALPPEGCSRVGGCNAYYAPVLDRLGP